MFYPMSFCLTSRKNTDQIFVKSLLRTKKSPLNFASHLDLDADLGIF